MNKEKRIGLNWGWVFTVCFFAMIIVSCQKNGPTTAVITVIDSAGRPVVGAAVTLWQDTAVNQVNQVKSNVRVTKPSDVSGRASFDFQLEAFLNVMAVKNNDTGKSFVRLKEHESVSVTVNL